jgi:hypothetical protein
MNPRLKSVMHALFCGSLLSPVGWALRAGVLLAIFAAVHLLGWRDATCIISGTAPDSTTALHGILYALAYFSAVILCPILILAAVLCALFRRLFSVR